MSRRTSNPGQVGGKHAAMPGQGGGATSEILRNLTLRTGLRAGQGRCIDCHNACSNSDKSPQQCDQECARYCPQ
jgi:hypothetical protein